MSHWLAAAAALAVSAGCGSDPGSGTPYPWDLPPGVPTPPVSAENPTTVEKALLGRYLFYDNRLSINEEQSCASCHEQRLGFADARTTPVGATGEAVPRNSQGLGNVAYAPHLTWGNHLLVHLEDQILIPIFGDDPIEMGMTDREDILVSRLKGDPLYQELFASAFPADPDPVSVPNLVRGLSSFVRSMTSFGSAIDDHRLGGDEQALSESTRRGMDLFFGRLECHQCHGGLGYTRAFVTSESTDSLRAFDNNGLYNIGGTYEYPVGGRGLYEVTGDPQDMGMFRPPSLRNVSVTGPYMHDGSIASLEELIDIYASGGRLIEGGDLAGDGRAHPNKSPFVAGFELSLEERADLLAFLRALRDDEFLNRAQLSNPH